MDQPAAIGFTGIENVEGGSYSLAHGRTPGVAIIYARSQPSPPPKNGSLFFTDNGNLIEFKDCTIDSAVLEAGDKVTYTIRDRRWKWQWPTVRGRYNVYDENGVLDTDTEKTPQELATLCLEAMGEADFSVADLPNVARPFVEWDYDNAAEALEQICEYLGCHIVLGVSGTVSLRVVGQGEQLTILNSIHDGGVVLDPPEVPNSIDVIAVTPDVLQYDFTLQAVGPESDGTTQKIDDLSYKPAGGWSDIDAEGDFANLSDPKFRAKASNAIFRWYRVDMDFGSDALNGLRAFLEKVYGDQAPQVLYRWQIELLNYQVETYTEDDIEVPRPPIVYGVFHDGRDLVTTTQSGNNVSELKPLDQTSSDEVHLNMIVPGGFSIDSKSQIVRLGFPAYKDDTPGTTVGKKQADLRLRIAFHVRELNTRALFHSKGVKSLGEFGTKPRVIKMAEPTRTAYPVFANSTSFAIDRVQGNTDKFTTEAQTVADAAAAEYGATQPVTYVYEGIYPIELDGAIQQVTWEAGNGTPKTTAYRNNDVRSVLLSYGERRARQKAAAAANQVVVIKAAQARQVVKAIQGGQ